MAFEKSHALHPVKGKAAQGIAICGKSPWNTTALGLPMVEGNELPTCKRCLAKFKRRAPVPQMTREQELEGAIREIYAGVQWAEEGQAAEIRAIAERVLRAAGVIP